MHTNGVGHLGNDTFIAATRDNTDRLFLVTSKITEERVTPLPLVRPVRFNLYSNGAPPLHHHHHHHHHHHTPTDNSVQAESEEVQHSFHPSVDGRHVAVISTGTTRHYVIDMLSTRVCEFTTRELVISVVWHPTSTRRLMLLLETGALLVFCVDFVKLGVAFEKVEKVQLGDTLIDFRDYTLGVDSASVTSELEVPCGRRRVPLLPLSLKLTKSTITLTEKTEPRSGAIIMDTEVQTPSSSSPPDELDGDAASSNNRASKVSDESDINGTETDGGKEDETDEAKGSAAAAAAAVVVVEVVEASQDAGSVVPREDRPSISEKGSGAVIGICVIPASRSLPAMLLALSRSGDIFSMKLDAEGVPTSLAKEYDGRVETIHGERRTERRVDCLFPCLHYLVRGMVAAAGYVEEPLAIGSAVVDEDVGRHVVFVLHNSGVLRGDWFSEPDLLCRNLMRTQMKLVIYLDAAFSPEQMRHPSAAALFAAHSVSVQTCGNASLIRYNDSAYLCVWPMWSRRTTGWVYRDEGMEGCQRVPVAGRGAEIPEPIALRLPYNVNDAGISVGVNDILIFPEVSGLTQPCARSRVMVVKIATLVLTALYAGGEKYSLTFGAVAAASDDSSNGKMSRKEEEQGQEQEQHNNMSHCRLEQLLELTATCCRQWLCGYPHETIDGSTAELACGLESIHREMKARQSMLQARRCRLAEQVAQLTQRQQELSRDVARSQSIVCDAVLHRRGVGSLYAANKTLGKIHVLLNEMEALVAHRREASTQATAAGEL